MISTCKPHAGRKKQADPSGLLVRQPNSCSLRAHPCTCPGVPPHVHLHTHEHTGTHMHTCILHTVQKHTEGTPALLQFTGGENLIGPPTRNDLGSFGTGGQVREQVLLLSQLFGEQGALSQPWTI